MWVYWSLALLLLVIAEGGFILSDKLPWRRKKK